MKNFRDQQEELYNQGIIKFIQYIQNNQFSQYNIRIQIEQFWEKHQISVTSDQFKHFLYSINFPDTDKYLLQIISQLKDSKKNITLEKLCKRVPFWNNSEEIMIDHIKQKALRIVQSAQRQRPQSGSYSQNRPISGISVQSKYSAFSDLKNLNVMNDDKIPVINKSKEYLKKHDKKQRELDQLLLITLKKGQYEYEYETQVKMAELNNMMQEQKNNIFYKIHKSQDQEMKIHRYEEQYYDKDFTLDEFQREYNIQKQHYIQYKKNFVVKKEDVKKELVEDNQQPGMIVFISEFKIKQIKRKIIGYQISIIRYYVLKQHNEVIDLSFIKERNQF